MRDLFDEGTQLRRGGTGLAVGKEGRLVLYAGGFYTVPRSPSTPQNAVRIRGSRSNDRAALNHSNDGKRYST